MKPHLSSNLAIAFLSGQLLLSVSLDAQQDLSGQNYLKQLRNVLPEDRRTTPGDQLPGTPPPHVSPEDFTWGDWLQRTGELPPDFDSMPSLPFLPDPLILDEGGKNIPVKTMDQWNRKREEMIRQAQHWITGTIPPPPGNIKAELLEEKSMQGLTEKIILLRFGPHHKAQLHVSLLMPPGEGPFPVFICPWKNNQYEWVQAAVRRGYIGCRFTATDPKYGYPDDSEAYEEIWWPDYDFSTIMRWGWAASRAIDYLYTLGQVNKEQIALTGLSRNGKMALWAAAYDDRIKAVVPISGGTGGEVPFRYTSDKYNNETMEYLTWVRPHWLHPRLRFYAGRENKMPVDQNSLMALVAPRGLMLTSSVTESAGNPWGVEQAYFSARKVYEFLGVADKIAIDHRHGYHSPSARDMERYLDFFDFVFGRNNIKPENKLYYDYSFQKWLGISGESVDPYDFPVKGTADLLTDSQGKTIRDQSSWRNKVQNIQKRILWGLGEEPPSLSPGNQTDYLREVAGLPRVRQGTESTPFMSGMLYFPAKEASTAGNDKWPVVIWLHEYSYAQGIASKGSLINAFLDAGIAVCIYDQLGFGTRNEEEARLFYQRYPKWSKMGRMLADVRWAVDALMENNRIDADKVFVAGYSVGAATGLYSAALDERIAGVVSVCGFTPMRTNTEGKTAEGIYEYSHLHGLIPKLGFFAGMENRIPYDFHEILACIAPRPMLVIAPTWDQYANHTDISRCMEEVKKAYTLLGAGEKVTYHAPDDYNRFSPAMQKQVIDWLSAR